MNLYKHSRLIWIQILITILIGISYYYAYQKETNNFNNNRRETKNNILNSLSTTLDHVSESANHFTSIIKNQINTKNLTFNEFNNLTEFEIYPFRNAIQNIRFSPIIYSDEINQHNFFGNTQINGYQIKPAGGINDASYYQKNNFFIPIYASNPLFFSPRTFGVDLYNISQIKNGFFHKFTSVNQTIVSSQILLGNSVEEFDFGIYFGKIITNHNCIITSADTFDNLVLMNQDTKCILGFTYIPFLVRDFVQGAIDFLLTTNKNIINQLKFGVYDITANQLLYYPNELLPFDSKFLQDNYDEKYFGKINFYFSNELFSVFFFFSDEIDSVEIKNQIKLIHILFPLVWALFMIINFVIYYLVNKNIQITHDKYQEISDLVKYVNHELRNPININNGYIDVSIIKLEKIIENNRYNTTDIIEIKKYLQIIKNSNRILSIIINDILDLQKSEKNQLQFTPNNFTLLHLMQQINISIKYKIDEHHEINFISLLAKKDEPIIIYNDENRIIQIIINFLTNAFKYTTQGNITLSFTNKKYYIEIAVSDTGKGISPKIQKLIFKEKFIGDNENAIRGVGIGLYLCNKLTHIIGGEIGFSSQINKGSVFWIHIPIKQQPIIDIP